MQGVSMKRDGFPRLSRPCQIPHDRFRNMVPFIGELLAPLETDMAVRFILSVTHDNHLNR